MVSLVGYHWRPTSDLALEVLQIRDVAGSHSPLVGVQSRFGYFHPGPAMFWALAPFDWVLGNTGILIGSAAIHAAAAAGAVVVAWRRGGAALGVLVALAALLVCRGMTAEILVEPWNPWIAVTPFLLFLLLAWSLAERDWPTLPWLVGVGSFVVQTHVGYAPVVLGVGGIAATLAVFGERRSGSDHTRPDRRRWLVIAGVVGGLLWLAPVIQQLTGSPGNLGELVDAFRHPSEPSAGWDAAFGIMGRQLSPLPPFVTGDETNPFGVLARSSTIPAILLLLATAAAGGLAWRRGARSAGRLALLVVPAAALGVIAASRILGIQAPYLVRWAWPIAAMVWVSLLWSAWSLVRETRAVRWALVAALVAVVVLSLGVSASAVGVRPPQDHLSDAIGGLAHDASPRIDPDVRYLMTWVDTQAVGSTGIGMFVELAERGFDVHVTKGLAHAFGSWRTAAPGEVDRALTVVSQYDFEEGWTPPADATRVAAYDPLTPPERARARRLDRRIRREMGSALPPGSLPITSERERDLLVELGADPQLVDELWRLREPGDRYYLYSRPV